MDIVDRLLGREPASHGPTLRADSIDLATQRLARALHPEFVRQDSIRLAKKRAAKRHSQQGQGDVEESEDDAVDQQQHHSTNARRLDGQAMTVHHADIHPAVTQSGPGRECQECHAAGQGAPGPAPAYVATKELAAIGQAFRTFITRLTGSQNSQAVGRQEQSTRRSISLGHHKSHKSDPGDRSNRPQPLHRYVPPPPGATLRPALRPATAPRPLRLSTASRTGRTGSWNVGDEESGTPARLRRSLSLDVQRLDQQPLQVQQQQQQQ